MKIIGRILILLIAAMVVIGATYALSQTAAGAALPGARGGRGGFEGHGELSQFPADFGGRSASAGQSGIFGNFERGPRGGGEFDREFGGLSLTVVLRNFAMIAVIILVVQLLRFGWRKLRPSSA